jgi:hypothetical protein
LADEKTKLLNPKGEREIPLCKFRSSRPVFYFKKLPRALQLHKSHGPEGRGGWNKQASKLS